VVWLGRERAPWTLCCRGRQRGYRCRCSCLSGNVPCVVSVVYEWWWRKPQYADVYSLKKRVVENTSGGGAGYRRIIAESDSRLITQTVGRIDARKTPINRKSLRRCWCGQRVEGEEKDAVTTFAVWCPVRRAGLCGRLHLPTQLC